MCSRAATPRRACRRSLSAEVTAQQPLARVAAAALADTLIAAYHAAYGGEPPLAPVDAELHHCARLLTRLAIIRVSCSQWARPGRDRVQCHGMTNETLDPDRVDRPTHKAQLLCS